MSQRGTQRNSKKSNTPKTSKSVRKEEKKLNRQTMAVTVIFFVIFLFMVGYYMYFIVFDSEDVANNSYNKRIDSQADTVIRGTIYSRGGKELAVTNTNGTENDLSDDTREYPYGKIFAHAVGITTHGKSGLEKLCNTDLLSSQSSAWQKIIDDFTDTAEIGSDVYTTLSVTLQKTAYNGLGDNDGAVFAMDPDTGEILVMTSKPSYNPETIDDIWDELAEDSDDSRLLNRATQGKYIPGSVFKIVTTLAYMRQNSNYNQFSYYCTGSATFNKFSIDCFNGNSHYSENLEEAFAYSCNSAFSTIGESLNVEEYAETATDLLFNSDLPLDMEYSESVFALDNDSTTFDITQTSIGQGETTVSPAHMAMIVSAIANNGVLKKPYIVDYVINSNGIIVDETEEEDYKRLMTKKEAKQLQKYMAAVCDYGTGRTLANTDYDAYGKTGTAELDKDDNINSWFVGYAKKGNKRLAVAVVYENVKQGSDSAIYCAKEIFDEYFD